MSFRTRAVGHSVATALAMGVITGVLAQDETVSVTVTVLPNQADDAGCLLGDVTMPGGDFGDFVSDSNGFSTGKDGVLSVPLSQDSILQSLDCDIEVIASDLTFASSSGFIPNGNITIAGCDIGEPVSLGGSQVLMCGVEAGDTAVEVALSLAGLAEEPTDDYQGTLTINNANGT